GRRPRSATRRRSGRRRRLQLAPRQRARALRNGTAGRGHSSDERCPPARAAPGSAVPSLEAGRASESRIATSVIPYSGSTLPVERDCRRRRASVLVGRAMPAGVGRRAFLQAAGALGLLALVRPRRLEALMASTPGPGQGGRFLTAHELDTLRAVTARFIPGPPDDPDPGALEAGVAEAIDLLLAAFTFAQPLIHAGGPFSDRAGATHDDFADFVPLDAHAELGWRIRIEGSLGIPQREFAGPVTGLQEIYRSGLAHLDERSQQAFGVDFKDAPGPAQDLLLSDQTDGDLQTFVGAALANTLEAMYGPPEYG